MMHIETLRDYCISKPGVTESFPFDESTLVFKVQGKMFLLTDTDTPRLSITIKAPPEDVILRQEGYNAVGPGYHMNKKYWISIEINADAPDHTIFNWIDQSYKLVAMKLPKNLRAKTGY